MASTLQRDQVEFTYEWYRTLLDHLTADGHRFGSFADGPQDGDVFLRHDVDLSLADAVSMAKIEADAGVQSTYCIWLTSPLYNAHEGEQRDRIQQLSDLGHDIGLHFNTRTYWDEEPRNESQLQQKVEQEQRTLGEIVPETTETVSFHRPPEWVLDRPFEGFQNTYAPDFFSGMSYHGDSNQRWREDAPAFESLSTPSQILVHPGLWGERDSEFERQVERGVITSCRYANRKAHDEFISDE